MNTDLIIRSLSFIAPLSDRLLEKLHRLMVEETHPKKFQLLIEGQTAKKIYFINKGFARAYYFTAEGRECTSWFWEWRQMIFHSDRFMLPYKSTENR